MICPNCGRESEGKFCPYCGTALTGAQEPAGGETAIPAPDALRQPAPNAGQSSGAYAEPSQAPDPARTYGAVPSQGYGPVNPGYVPRQGYNPGAVQTGAYIPGQPVDPAVETPARAALRRSGASGVFLTAILSYTLGTVLSLTQSVMNLVRYGSANLSTVVNIHITGAARTGEIISLILTAMVMLIMMGALWSIRGNARSGNPLKTGGLTCLKVFVVIALVLVCLAAVIVTAGLLIAYSRSDLGSLSISVNGIADEAVIRKLERALQEYFWVFFAVMALIMALVILYFAKLVQSLNAAKRIIRSGMPDKRISAFVGIMCFLAAAGLLIGNAVNLAQIPSYVWAALDASFYLLSVLPALLNLAALFFFGMTVFKALGAQKALLH